MIHWTQRHRRFAWFAYRALDLIQLVFVGLLVAFAAFIALVW